MRPFARVLLALVAVTALHPGAAAAQLTRAPGPPTRAAAPAPPSRQTDPGHVVLLGHLGGDSVQVTTVEFRRGATYLVQVRPSRAEIVIRRRTQGGESVTPLDQTPVPRTDSDTAWTAFSVTAGEAGTHFVELTNAGVGPTVVRISFVHSALPPTVSRTVLADSVSSTDRRPHRGAGLILFALAIGVGAFSLGH